MKKTAGFITVVLLGGILLLVSGAYSVKACYSFFTSVLPSINSRLVEMGIKEFQYSWPYFISIFFGGILTLVLGILSLGGGINMIFFRDLGRKLLLIVFSIRLLYMCTAPLIVNFTIERAVAFGVSPPPARDVSMDFKNYILIVVYLLLMYYFSRHQAVEMFKREKQARP